MTITRKMAASLFGLVVILLTACSPKVTPVPTQSLGDIQTEVALSVQLGLTQTAASMPTATHTIQPTQTQQPSPTATQTPRQTSQAAATIPPAVNPQTTSTVPDKAQWLYNIPDDTVTPPTLPAGQPFTVTWRIRNTGTSTWTTDYSFRFFLGDSMLRMGAQDITMPKEVPPGEEVDLTLTFTAPTAPGDYNTWWVVSNKDLVNFLNLNFSFKVAGS